MGAEATHISAFTAAAAHALCLAGLAAAHSFAGRGALVSDPVLALRLLVVCEAPLVIAVFSLLRRDPKRCSFLKASARGLLGLPMGAFLNAFAAIVLGAPVGIKYWIATTYWSLLMSLFTFVPAACVFGASKVNWQNVLSHSIYCRPTDVVDYMISAPSHGAVIGAWLGAWPMPLDWERPWQTTSQRHTENSSHHRCILNEKSALAMSISSADDDGSAVPSGSSLCSGCATGYMSLSGSSLCSGCATGYMPVASSNLGEAGVLWGSSDLTLFLWRRCTGDVTRLGDVPRLGVVSPLICAMYASSSRIFFFSLAIFRQFIRALTVCSSKIVFFMCEPICK